MKSLLVSRPISSSSSSSFFFMSLSYPHCEEEEVYNDFTILSCYAGIRIQAATDLSHPKNSMKRYEIRQNLGLYQSQCLDLYSLQDA